MTPRTKRWARRLAFTTIAAYLAAYHWPLLHVLYAGVTGSPPSQTAYRYAFRFDPSSPVLRALGRQSIYEGQPLDEVIERYDPFRVTAAGRWVELREPGNYVAQFEGWVMLARDGRLAYACRFNDTKPHEVVFFDALSEEEHRECGVVLWARRRQIGADRRDAWRATAGALAVESIEVLRADRTATERAAGMAVSGPLPYLAHYEPPAGAFP